MPEHVTSSAVDSPVLTRWAKVIDHSQCIGCHACSTACKSENEVPLSVNRTYVKYVDVGLFPQARRAFQVTRCNQCEHAPCVAACPTSAMYRRKDGIVDFDKQACIGCKACIAACPYDAIFINPADHSAEKCNFCAHRLDIGLEPACVVVCPTEAILVGDLNDPASRVSQIVHRDVVHVRRPEKDTLPKVFYKGAHQATLDPLAATRPDGGLFMWSEQLQGGQHIVSGHPHRPNSSAAALLSYDVPHIAPWDWRVSLYTWTKSIAAGAYLVPALLVLAGLIDAAGVLWQWVAPLMAGVFLAVTGGILILDLEHPTRFYYLFTRPQRRSWLVKGAYIIGGYGLVLALHLAAALARPDLLLFIAVPGGVLAAGVAVYTAYLFAQAKARDLWQSPMLAPHLFVQACVAGAAAILLVGLVDGLLTVAEQGVLLSVAGVAAVLHLLFVLSETTFFHPTAHARLAVEEMVWGRHRTFFWSGVVLMLPAVAAPWIGPVVVPLALGALLAYEHAYVQAGQSVPLA
jgi:Fe-S-cluster-containing dehydrogenase component/formate-dependent nitrite reductase membrane component NrfD